jgi:hypothetical protein
MKNNPLAKELFEKLQAIQGHAFISDAIEDLDLNDEEVINYAKMALEETEICKKILRKFIRENEHEKEFKRDLTWEELNHFYYVHSYPTKK